MESIAHEFLGVLVTPPRPGQFKLAFTPNIVNKEVVQHKKEVKYGKEKDVTYTKFFDTEWVDYERLAEIVCGNGWAISRPFTGEKSDATINTISYVGLDFDGITEEQFETIKQQPFVKDRGFFHYSASHGKKAGVSAHWICPLELMAEISTDEHRHAWRLILMEIVDSIKLGDRKVKDLQRLFYGAQGQPFEVWGADPITVEELEAFYAQALEKEAEQEKKRKEAQENSTRRRSKHSYSYEKAVDLTRDYIVPQLTANKSFPDIEWEDGTIMDSYDAWIGYFLGWKEDIGIDLAAKLMDEFAPDTTMGSYKKLKSFKNENLDASTTGSRIRRYTFGTTMKILRHYGFFPEGSEAFGQTVIESDKQLEVRHLSMPDITPPTDQKCIMVKSPKGSGKTELIAQIAASGLRVLVIGHRRALLRNTTGRTGIPNYQNVVPAEATSLCITVDSLFKLDLKRQEFDVVIIDEVEQVLQHCIGDTLKDGRAAALSLFRILLRDTDKIYCFDADLSFVSINFMKKQIGVSDVYVVDNVNSWNSRTIQMFPSKYDIIRATEHSLSVGEKIALATNSKRVADTVEEQMKTRFPDAKIMSITQENSDDPDVQDFIQNIQTRVTEVDLLIYSPSLGTGVSIDTLHFDYVHLIGVKDVTTHFDLDQQINRVRNIKGNIVRAWIGQLYPDDILKEVDVEKLKQLCVLNAHETGIDLTFNEDRSLAVASHDAWYVELWADITSLRNSSMNSLEQCFIKLMKEQGHHVVSMKSNKQENQKVKARNLDASTAVDQRRIQSIVDAELPDLFTFEALTRLDSLTYVQKRQLEKYDISEFYQQVVTPEIVLKDNQGRFRETVILLEMAADYQDAEYYDVMESSVRKGLHELEARVMIPHRKFYGPKKAIINDFLEKAGLGRIEKRQLKAFGEAEIWYSNKSLQKNGFVDWLKDPEVQSRLERHLDMKLRSNFEDQPALAVGLLIRKLGFDITEKRPSVKGAKNNIKDIPNKEYCVTKFSVEEMRALVEARGERYHQVVEDTALMNAIMVEYEFQGKKELVEIKRGSFISYAGNDEDDSEEPIWSLKAS